MKEVNGIEVSFSVPAERVGGVEVGLSMPKLDAFSSVEIPQSDAATRERVLSSTDVHTVDTEGGRLSRKVEHEKAKELKARFVDLRDIVTGGVSYENASDFRVNFNLATASFLNKAKDRETVDLLDLDPKYETFVREFLDLANEVTDYRSNARYAISKNSKGSLNGAAPLQRSTSALKKLPTSFAGASAQVLAPYLATLKTPEERNRLVERVGYAQALQGQLLTSFDQKIEKLDAEYRKHLLNQHHDVKARAEVNRLNGVLTALKERRKEVEGLDAYALTIALTHYPTTEKVFPEELDAAAKKARDIPFAGKKEQSREERAYALDVGGLFYQTRWEYAEYTGQNHMPIKKEGVEDVILRTVLFGADKLTKTADMTKEMFDVIGPDMQSAARVAKLSLPEIDFDAGLEPLGEEANGDEKKARDEKLTETIQTKLRDFHTKLEANLNKPWLEQPFDFEAYPHEEREFVQFPREELDPFTWEFNQPPKLNGVDEVDPFAASSQDDASSVEL